MKQSLILPGATLRDRIIASLGAMAGIGLTGFLSAVVLGQTWGQSGNLTLPLLAAPMGAVAILLFATPASPLAQPWPIIGGTVISALAGIITARVLHQPMLAAGIAVALATIAMSLTRSLHPPGGGVALLQVLCGKTVTSAGFLFAFIPIGLNCVMLVALGIIFHRFMSGHSYPHQPAPLPANTHNTADLPAPLRTGLRAPDIDGAPADFGAVRDIDRNDLDRLLRLAETRTATHALQPLTCAAIMSRDVIQVLETATPQAARALLLNHDIRTLPVTDATGLLTGAIGLRELARATSPGPGSTLMAQAITATPGQPATTLITPLTNGTTRAIIIVDPTGRATGIVTQTDLLAALTHA